MPNQDVAISESDIMKRWKPKPYVINELLLKNNVKKIPTDNKKWKNNDFLENKNLKKYLIFN